ncbi:MAG: hypothetical protein MJ105_00275 [Lachnospiraceae bacterium]|nr:hypothetical protein [Lachnospiraceae bacterium]
MKSKGFISVFKRVVAFLGAAAIVAGGFTGYSMQAKAASGAYTYKDVLGEALNYGIVAARYEQHGDTQTNAAVKEWAGADGGISPDLSYGSNITFVVGEFENVPKFNHVNNSLTNVDFYFPSSRFGVGQIVYQGDFAAAPPSFTQTQHSTTQSDINSYVDKLVAAVNTKSQAIAGLSADITLGEAHCQGTSNAYVIDASAISAPIVVVNVPDSAKYILSYNWCIKKKENQTVIFNYLGTESVRIEKMHLQITDRNTADGFGSLFVESGSEGGTTYFSNAMKATPDTSKDSLRNQALDAYFTQKIIFNFPNVNGGVDKAIEIGDSVAGVFVAPKAGAYVRAWSTTTGYVVTGGTVYTQQEWHYLDGSSAKLTGIDPDTDPSGNNKPIVPPGTPPVTPPTNPTVAAIQYNIQHYVVTSGSRTPEAPNASTGDAVVKIEALSESSTKTNISANITSGENILTSSRDVVPGTYQMKMEYTPDGTSYVLENGDKVYVKVAADGAVTYSTNGVGGTYSATVPTFTLVRTVSPHPDLQTAIQYNVKHYEIPYGGSRIGSTPTTKTASGTVSLVGTLDSDVQNPITGNIANATVKATGSGVYVTPGTYQMQMTYTQDADGYVLENGNMVYAKVAADGSVTYSVTGIYGTYTSTVPTFNLVKTEPAPAAKSITTAIRYQVKHEEIVSGVRGGSTPSTQEADAVIKIVALDKTSPQTDISGDINETAIVPLSTSVIPGIYQMIMNYSKDADGYVLENGGQIYVKVDDYGDVTYSTHGYAGLYTSDVPTFILVKTVTPGPTPPGPGGDPTPTPDPEKPTPTPDPTIPVIPTVSEDGTKVSVPVVVIYVDADAEKTRELIPSTVVTLYDKDGGEIQSVFPNYIKEGEARTAFDLDVPPADETYFYYLREAIQPTDKNYSEEVDVWFLVSVTKDPISGKVVVTFIDIITGTPSDYPIFINRSQAAADDGLEIEELDYVPTTGDNTLFVVGGTAIFLLVCGFGVVMNLRKNKED